MCSKVKNTKNSKAPPQFSEVIHTVKKGSYLTSLEIVQRNV